jgi:hypothetical protein
MGKDEHQWLMPAILLALEAEIRRMVVGGQPRQKVRETPISTNKSWSHWYVTGTWKV